MDHKFSPLIKTLIKSPNCGVRCVMVVIKRLHIRRSMLLNKVQINSKLE